MVRTDKENVQAIIQAKCTNCGESDNNYRITDSEHRGSNVVHKLKCECDTEATVRITPDGVSSDDAVSYQNASWNQSDN